MDLLITFTIIAVVIAAALAFGVLLAHVAIRVLEWLYDKWEV